MTAYERVWLGIKNWHLWHEHNNANIICLPAGFVSEEKALEIAKAFLAASFEGGRHQERVQKIEQK